MSKSIIVVGNVPQEGLRRLKAFEGDNLNAPEQIKAVEAAYVATVTQASMDTIMHKLKGKTAQDPVLPSAEYKTAKLEMYEAVLALGENKALMEKLAGPEGESRIKETAALMAEGKMNVGYPGTLSPAEKEIVAKGGKDLQTLNVALGADTEAMKIEGKEVVKRRENDMQKDAPPLRVEMPSTLNLKMAAEPGQKPTANSAPRTH